jgi:hypothetical protein
METTENGIKDQLEKFHGSQQLHFLPICRTRYTEGVWYLAQAAQAYWLLSDASVMGKSLANKSYFITVDFKKLSLEEKEEVGFDATISYGDGNGNIFEVQKYHITDFPLDEIRLFFVDGTLMLPPEY